MRESEKGRLELKAELMAKSTKSEAPPATWRRTLSGFEPADDQARSFWQKSKPGDIIELTGRRPRNLKHHRKYWILMQIVVDNSDDFDTPETVNYAVKAAMNRGKWIQPAKAKRALFIPESISFANMDQEAFDRFYTEAVNAITRHFLPGCTPEQIDDIIMQF